MKRQHRIVVAGIVAILAAGRTTFAGLSVNLQTWAQSDGTFWTQTAYVYATPQQGDPSYTTYEVASTDGQYVITSDDVAAGTGFHANFYTSLNNLIPTLPSSWTITLDKGLATEHVYTSTVNYGDLSGLTAPVVTSPTNNSTITTLHPTFTFTLPSQISAYTIDLQHFVKTASGGTGVRDAFFGVPSTTTSWTPDFSLTPSTSYYFDVDGQTNLPGFTFSTPTDGDGNTLPNFTAEGTLDLERSLPFSTAPEPGTVGCLAIAAGVLAARRRRG